MRELSLQDIQHVSGATKENLELYLYISVPSQAGELFGSLLPQVLNNTLSLEEFAKAILASTEVVDGSQVKSMEISAWYSMW
jgi:hypothetical protein